MEEGLQNLIFLWKLLSYYINNGFKSTQISKMLQISLSTVKPRLKENNLTKKETNTKLNDKQLDMFINDLLSRFPNIGYKRISSFKERKK